LAFYDYIRVGYVRLPKASKEEMNMFKNVLTGVTRPNGNIGETMTWLVEIVDTNHSLAARIASGRTIGFIRECWLIPTGCIWTPECLKGSGHQTLLDLIGRLHTDKPLKARVCSNFAAMTVPHADVSAMTWYISLRQIAEVGQVISIIGGIPRLMEELRQPTSAAQAA
jgi:hypothetical protein